MASQTGRTVRRWLNLIVGDSGDVLRAIPVNSINGLGLESDEADVSAWQDAVKNSLPDTPGGTVEVSGPFDNSVAVAAPALSGSHTVLSGIYNDSKPHSLDIQIGIRHAWEAGEPQWGLTRASASNSGFTCVGYTVDPESMTYTAKFAIMGGVAPAWGTAAETAGS